VPLSLPGVASDLVLPTGWEWLALLGVGVTTQIAQIFLTRGLAHEKAGAAMSIGYIQIVFAIAWGVLLFGERPDLPTLAGAGLVVAGTLAMSLKPKE
jgi:drug/metabolite transporter (DMT)-like permease